MSKRFRDQDMLARSGDGYDEQHVSKRKQRNKALEIVFDPKSHKYVLAEYIHPCNGFKLVFFVHTHIPASFVAPLTSPPSLGTENTLLAFVNASNNVVKKH